jgi:hypothetical protein
MGTAFFGVVYKMFPLFDDVPAGKSELEMVRGGVRTASAIRKLPGGAPAPLVSRCQSICGPSFSVCIRLSQARRPATPIRPIRNSHPELRLN